MKGGNHVRDRKVLLHVSLVLVLLLLLSSDFMLLLLLDALLWQSVRDSHICTS